MAKNVKIYEIARRLGIKSGELVKICQRAGYGHITHYSNAVPAEEAEEIRKAAIRLYRPKEEAPAKEPTAEKITQAPEKPKKSRQVPSTDHVKPTAPPSPKGQQARVARRKREEGKAAAPEEVKETQKPRRAPERRRRVDKGTTAAPRTRRTVVFRQVKKPPTKKRETRIELTPPVTVRNLSERMGVSASEIIKKLMLEHEIRANINQTIDAEIAGLIGVEFDVEINFRAAKSASEKIADLIPEDTAAQMQSRPTVVALLGHVDHGKTSILDRIRNTQVAEREDGGITQDIGAWQITCQGQPITFVDTPGHEAFTGMRARGAQVTDLVILVVAADDGVMAQTEEAISHARAAAVPIVVAINKVDRPEANTMRVLQQLAAHELNPEQWGGEVGCVEVSAVTGQGIETLLERILLEAELLEPEANPDRRADGVVLEARMEEGRGVVANVIVRNGRLRKGDIVLCGSAFGRVRSLTDQSRVEVQEAGPAKPVAMSGLDRVPEEGSAFVVVEDLDVARSVAEEHRSRLEEERRQPRSHVTLENLYESLASGQGGQLRVILKADVKGTLEPLASSLDQLGTDEVSVQALHQGVGEVNASDVLLADASDAIIIAFRVGTEERARTMARERGVDVRYYRVIYEAISDVRDALEGLLAPEQREERLGVAEVRQVFRISRVGNVAGCYVRDGEVRRGAQMRMLRDGTVVYEGILGSLRREKDDVSRVEAGYECGIKIRDYNDVQVGDLIECYTVREVKRALS